MAEQRHEATAINARGTGMRQDATYKVQQFKVRLVKDGAARVVARDRVPGAPAAAELFRAAMRGIPHEEVWLALVGATNDVRGLVRVSQGGMHGAALKPTDLLRVVIAAGVDSFVMAHNHPSGDPSPSVADIEMTRALLAACRVVGVNCLDHLIVTSGDGWSSLRECEDLEW